MTTYDAYHHGDLRNALEHAALALVEEKGAENFSLSEAARRAGVSPSAPYKHFAERDALLAAIAEKGHRFHYGMLRTALAGVESPAEIMRITNELFLTFAVEQHAFYQASYRSHLDAARYPQLMVAYQRVLDITDAAAAALRTDPEIAAGLALASNALRYGFAATFLFDRNKPTGESLDTARRQVGRATLALVDGY
ncbi:TetR/AcrR family transcriptional regulator [Lacisediminihabitans changchengi]|uniref:TetR/AcrR family transcriptional regulator n=1 Tax=Lacisediminihabitans changchengi TaxID=2787634 RepID=A0A934SP82_9MICO|nr:TetR/AcrR family transcriptional regulator [Lacisediminihabitans changchengi]MBK4346538.1 TetR/AcrR family transcriptional regulator [Lacisediminihabitans changchengi]